MTTEPTTTTTPTRAGRDPDALRRVDIQLDFVPYPEGSVLFSAGNTRVLCNATVERGVPRWLKDQGLGWITAEYAMLPAATHTRGRREVKERSGRTMEIQRLIGRALRAAVDRSRLGERTILIDCDVIQADGGTRTASITGAFIALALACARLIDAGELAELPLVRSVAAISAGIVGGEPRLDLEYAEDSAADVDMNLVVTGTGDIVEIQGTGEGGVLRRSELDALIDMAARGCLELTRLQALALAPWPVLRPLFTHLETLP